MIHVLCPDHHRKTPTSSKLSIKTKFIGLSAGGIHCGIPNLSLGVLEKFIGVFLPVRIKEYHGINRRLVIQTVIKYKSDFFGDNVADTNSGTHFIKPLGIIENYTLIITYIIAVGFSSI